jgi:CheY-like chemotaxis protein
MDELRQKLNHWLTKDSTSPDENFSADMVQYNTGKKGDEKKRILVAEDNEANKELLELQLNILGYDADFAKDGIEAFAAWERGDYELLLTDIHMPRMGGYELAGKIRQTKRFAESDMKIVAVSAEAKESLVKGCKEAGIDDYISKPVFVDILKEKLEKWLPSEDTIQDIKDYSKNEYS